MVLLVLKIPPPPKTEKCPPKGPPEYAKRSKVHCRVYTVTVSLINDAAYYSDIDLDAVEDLNKFCYQISYIGYVRSKITIQRKVHLLHAKNLPAELPGYSLASYPVSLVESLVPADCARMWENFPANLGICILSVNSNFQIHATSLMMR